VPVVLTRFQAEQAAKPQILAAQLLDLCERLGET
jgi:hypothetical protein